MNSAELETFNRAVGLAQAGQKDQAQAELKRLETTNPNDANLLLWLAFTSTDLGAARAYLDRASRFDPSNPSLAAAHTWLVGEEAKHAPPVATTSSYSPYSSAAVSYGSYATTPEPAPYAPAQPPMSPALDPLPTYQAPVPPPPPQPAVSQGVPDWYRAERDDEAPERRRRILIRLGIIVGGVVAVVAVVALVLAVFGVFNPPAPTAPADKIAAQGLPVYPGARHIVLLPEDQAKLDSSLNSNLNKSDMSNYKFDVELYTLKGTEKAKVATFFDTELKKLGWTAPPNNTFNKDPFTGKGYAKGENILIAEWATISNDTSLVTITHYNLSVGDVLLIVATLNKS